MCATKIIERHLYVIMRLMSPSCSIFHYNSDRDTCERFFFFFEIKCSEMIEKAISIRVFRIDLICYY